MTWVRYARGHRNAANLIGRASLWHMLKSEEGAEGMAWTMLAFACGAVVRPTLASGNRLVVAEMVEGMLTAAQFEVCSGCRMRERSLLRPVAR